MDVLQAALHIVAGTDVEPLLEIGIPGLDDVLNGGLPAGHLYLMEGDPGTGKTTIAMQFLQEGVREGEKTLYVTNGQSVAAFDVQKDGSLTNQREFAKLTSGGGDGSKGGA